MPNISKTLSPDDAAWVHAHRLSLERRGRILGGMAIFAAYLFLTVIFARAVALAFSISVVEGIGIITIVSVIFFGATISLELQKENELYALSGLCAGCMLYLMVSLL